MEEEYEYELSEDATMSYAESRLILISKILVIFGIILAIAGVIAGLIAMSETWRDADKITFLIFGVIGGALSALPCFAAAMFFRVTVEKSMTLKEIRDKLNFK